MMRVRPGQVWHFPDSQFRYELVCLIVSVSTAFRSKTTSTVDAHVVAYDDDHLVSSEIEELYAFEFEADGVELLGDVDR